MLFCYRCSVNRLGPGLRGAEGSPEGSSAGPAPRKITGVPPEMPVSNRWPLTTVKLLSAIGAGGVEDSLESGRRLRATSRSKPNAASNATPPNEPTIAGTRGTTFDFAACAWVDVDEEVGIPVVPGLAIVVIDPNVVDVVNVETPDAHVELRLPAELIKDDADEIALGAIVPEVELKKGEKVGREEEVRFVGKLVTISVEDTGAEVLAPDDGDPVIDVCTIVVEFGNEFVGRTFVSSVELLAVVVDKFEVISDVLVGKYNVVEDGTSIEDNSETTEVNTGDVDLVLVCVSRPPPSGICGWRSVRLLRTAESDEDAVRLPVTVGSKVPVALIAGILVAEVVEFEDAVPFESIVVRKPISEEIGVVDDNDVVVGPATVGEVFVP